jgi:ATP-dependent helicase/nuclease subunit A
MSPKWTPEQEQAITARGSNTLVAAAAGSGKTAVLVERIITYLTDSENPVDVDRLLVVTFTNAAAAEMKKRIGEALEKTLKQRPGSLYLRKQLSLVNRANISTLHSFCMDVVRRYYYQIDIDPSFRILDDTERVLLQEQVLEEIFEEEYSDDSNQQFFSLVDRYSSDRGDDELQKLILDLYGFSQSHPWPEKWLDDVVSQYDVGHVEHIEQLPWGKQLLDGILQEIEDSKQLLQRGKKICLQEGGPEVYLDTFKSDEAVINNLISAGQNGWNELYNTFENLKFVALSRKKGEDETPELREKAKKYRDQTKKAIDSIKKTYFMREPSFALNDLVEMAPALKKLVEVTKTFANRFQQKKREKGVVDFNDLEHYCLTILRADDSNKEVLKPSGAALDYQEKFVEVFVDEYQDTNHVQEAILQLVTKDNNMFMVGDVKQSIYRFRLAEPFLFINKYKAFSINGNEHGLRIDLAKNFRSRKEILDGTNYLFKQVMNEKVGEIEYDEAAELKLGASYPEHNDVQGELILIDRKGEGTEVVDDEEDDVDLENIQLEARYISKKIKQLIGTNGDQPYEVFDKNTESLRPVTYRDIVILLRGTAKEAPILLEEFKQNGIPSYAELTKGYFDATEISVMMSLLRIIDNPMQDIPFTAVLRSPIVKLSGSELAKIRIEQNKSNFYEAVVHYVSKDEGADDELSNKLSQFLTDLQRWRQQARQGSLADLIWQLYKETGYFDFVGGMVAGMQRQANLKALYDRARQYEATSFRGLFRFLRFIERMQDRGSDLGTARALGEQEDVVRIMTIHKSKGLEFPVVFVAGIGKQFNEQDLRKKVLMHKDFGFGTKFIDPDLRVSYPTLPMQAMKKKMKMEMLAEEMRILYVALTRAKEKMYLLGTVKDVEKEIEDWSDVLDHSEWLLPNDIRSNANRYLSWIGPALMRHEHCKELRNNLPFQSSEMNQEIYKHSSAWKVEIHSARDLQASEVREEHLILDRLINIQNLQPVDVESDYVEKVNQNLSWNYKNRLATTHRSKQSVTEMKRVHALLADNEQYKPKVIEGNKKITKRPKFMQKGGLTAAEKGTALHTVMQHVPLQKDMNENLIKETMNKLIEKEILTVEQRNAVNIETILQFFSSDLGQRMLNADRVEREIPFSFGIKTKEAFQGWDEQDETVIVQGVIDCLLIEEDGIVLIDFKTDSIKHYSGGFAEAKPILEDRYKKQIELYSQAVEEIWCTKLKEKYLYFFDGSNVIIM